MTTKIETLNAIFHNIILQTRQTLFEILWFQILFLYNKCHYVYFRVRIDCNNWIISRQAFDYYIKCVHRFIPHYIYSTSQNKVIHFSKQNQTKQNLNKTTTKSRQCCFVVNLLCFDNLLCYVFIFLNQKTLLIVGLYDQSLSLYFRDRKRLLCLFVCLFIYLLA